MLEASRIADQLRRAFSGDAWHGSPLSELLSDVAADQAFAHPLPSAHTIWELVLHIDAWVNAALQAAQGDVMPKLVGTDGDWPPIRDNSPQVWVKTKAHFFEGAEQLAKAVAAFSDETTRHRSRPRLRFLSLVPRYCATQPLPWRPDRAAEEISRTE